MEPAVREVYAAVFIDAIVVKVRDGQVGTQPYYAAHRQATLELDWVAEVWR